MMFMLLINCAFGFVIYVSRESTPVTNYFPTILKSVVGFQNAIYHLPRVVLICFLFLNCQCIFGVGGFGFEQVDDRVCEDANVVN